MEKANKNTHLNHLEDMVFLGHIDGTRDAVHFIRKLRDLLLGHTQRDLQTSVKWDGAPAIYMGPHPVSKKFFVAKKSLFNKRPLYYTSVKEIKASSDLSSELKKKFELAFDMFHDAKFEKIVQGDFLFDATDLKTENIDGEKFIVFHPNTIAYSIPEESDLAKTISKKKLGIVFHTTYSGSSISSLTSKAGVTLPKLSDDVWAVDANYDMTTLLTKGQVKDIDDELSNIGTHFRHVSRDTFTKMNDPVIAAFATTFTNSFIRANKTPTPEEAANGLPEFIMQKFKVEIEKRKTAKGQAKQQEAMKAALAPIMTVPKHELLSMFHLYYSLQKAKNILIKRLSTASFVKTFLKTTDGWKVTGQEGFVASDKLGVNSIKLVDRLEFSYANFNQDVIKGWQSDFRR